MTLTIEMVADIIDQEGARSAAVKRAVAKRLGCTNTQASKHLTALVDAKYLYRVAFGQQMYYAVDPSLMLEQVVTLP